MVFVDVQCTMFRHRVRYHFHRWTCGDRSATPIRVLSVPCTTLWRPCLIYHSDHPVNHNLSPWMGYGSIMLVIAKIRVFILRNSSTTSIPVVKSSSICRKSAYPVSNQRYRLCVSDIPTLFFKVCWHHVLLRRGKSLSSMTIWWILWHRILRKLAVASLTGFIEEVHWMNVYESFWTPTLFFCRFDQQVFSAVTRSLY